MGGGGLTGEVSSCPLSFLLQGAHGLQLLLGSGGESILSWGERGSQVAEGGKEGRGNQEGVMCKGKKNPGGDRFKLSPSNAEKKGMRRPSRAAPLSLHAELWCV